MTLFSFLPVFSSGYPHVLAPGKRDPLRLTLYQSVEEQSVRRFLQNEFSPFWLEHDAVPKQAGPSGQTHQLKGKGQAEHVQEVAVIKQAL